MSDKLLNAVKGQEGMISLMGQHAPIRDFSKVTSPHVSAYHH